jgi:hypothetical protein
MIAKYTVQHHVYTGSTDDDGYPTGDEFAAPVDRPAYGLEPLSSRLDTSGTYDRRVITSKVMGVPDPGLFSPRDKVVWYGAAYFVSEDVRDYTTGPFSRGPGGEVVLEVVTG